MAVDLNSYFPFDSGPGASVAESGWRDMMKHMLGSASGVIRGFANEFQTIGDSSGMQVKVDAGECWMRGHYGISTSQKTLPISSNASGNPRIDIAVLRCHFANNNIVVDIVQGTPAASPTAPAVTQNTAMWETKLADVAVANGAVTITAGNVTDKRVYTSVAAKYSRTTSQSISNATQTDIQYTTADFISGDVVPNGTLSQFTLLRSGLWALSANGGFAGNTGGSRSILIKDGAGANTYSETTVSTTGSGTMVMNTSTLERFPAGQVVKCAQHQSSGVALGTVATMQFSMMWVGP